MRGGGGSRRLLLELPSSGIPDVELFPVSFIYNLPSFASSANLKPQNANIRPFPPEPQTDSPKGAVNHTFQKHSYTQPFPFVFTSLPGNEVVGTNLKSTFQLETNSSDQKDFHMDIEISCDSKSRPFATFRFYESWIFHGDLWKVEKYERMHGLRKQDVIDEGRPGEESVCYAVNLPPLIEFRLETWRVVSLLVLQCFPNDISIHVSWNIFITFSDIDSDDNLSTNLKDNPVKRWLCRRRWDGILERHAAKRIW